MWGVKSAGIYKRYIIHTTLKEDSEKLVLFLPTQPPHPHRSRRGAAPDNDGFEKTNPRFPPPTRTNAQFPEVHVDEISNGSAEAPGSRHPEDDLANPSDFCLCSIG
jgi:hypothetical protein